MRKTRAQIEPLNRELIEHWAQTIPADDWTEEQAALIDEWQDTLRCERSLYWFYKRGWNVIEPGTPFQGGKVLKVICLHLMALFFGIIKNLLINIPPRVGKSSLCAVAFPVWGWLHNPSEQWLFSSYVHALSIRDSRKCRDLIQSPWFQRRWGHKFRLVGDSNTLTRFDNDHKGYRLATSVEGYNTGEGASILVFDDPNAISDVFYESSRVGVINWFRRVMSTRLNNMKTGRRLVIQQRAHQQDLSGDIIARDVNNRWIKLILPVWFEENRRCHTGLVTEGPISMWRIDTSDPKGWRDWREKDGELLWPERFGPEELAALREDLEAWDEAGQLQQRPAPAEGGTFKADAWNFYFRRDLPRKIEASCISVDLAFKGKKDSAYNVFELWIYAEGRFILVDWRRSKAEYRIVKRELLKFFDDYSWVDTVLIEDAANAAAAISDLQDAIPCLCPITPEGDKEIRALSVAPIQENGKIWLPMKIERPGIQDLVDEFNVFPNSRYKDFTDAMTQAIRFLRYGGRRRRSRKKFPRRREFHVAGL